MFVFAVQSGLHVLKANDFYVQLGLHVLAADDLFRIPDLFYIFDYWWLALRAKAIYGKYAAIKKSGFDLFPRFL